MMQRIMIVDDDIPIGDMLEEVLEKEGYQVSRAYSARRRCCCSTPAGPIWSCSI